MLPRFGELIFQQGLAHAGVTCFRLSGVLLSTKNRTAQLGVKEHTEALEGGAFVEVSPGRIRVADRPRT
jgi:hypothetical protein